MIVSNTRLKHLISIAKLGQSSPAGHIDPLNGDFVPGISFETRYGFVHLKQRSLAPAACAYMSEIRVVEAEFVEREKQLAVLYKDLLR